MNINIIFPRCYQGDNLISHVGKAALTIFHYASVNGAGKLAVWKHHETIEVSHKILIYFISEKRVRGNLYL